MGAIVPKGLKRLWNSSKTWMVVIATFIIFYLEGGFTADKTEAIQDVIGFLKWAIPAVIMAVGVEDAGGKIFGKAHELIVDKKP